MSLSPCSLIQHMKRHLNLTIKSSSSSSNDIKNASSSLNVSFPDPQLNEPLNPPCLCYSSWPRGWCRVEEHT